MTEITIEYDLEKTEDDHLKKVFESDDTTQKIKKLAETALREYLKMIFGKRVFTRAQDLFEYRLLILMKSGIFGDDLPDARIVGDLFQMTNSRAESLIRASISKYRLEIEPDLIKFLIRILRKAKPVGADGWIIKTDPYIKERFNSILADMNIPVEGVKNYPDLVSTYLISDHTCEKLCEEFGLTKTATKII